MHEFTTFLQQGNLAPFILPLKTEPLPVCTYVVTVHVLWCVKAASTLSQIPHGCICAHEDNGVPCGAVLKGEDYFGPAALVIFPSTWELLDCKTVLIFKYACETLSYANPILRGKSPTVLQSRQLQRKSQSRVRQLNSKHNRTTELIVD